MNVRVVRPDDGPMKLVFHLPGGEQIAVSCSPEVSAAARERNCALLVRLGLEFPVLRPTGHGLETAGTFSLTPVQIWDVRQTAGSSPRRCEDCGELIPPKRLAAQPAATVCCSCQGRREQGQPLIPAHRAQELTLPATDPRDLLASARNTRG